MKNSSSCFFDEDSEEQEDSLIFQLSTIYEGCCCTIYEGCCFTICDGSCCFQSWKILFFKNYFYLTFTRGPQQQVVYPASAEIINPVVYEVMKSETLPLPIFKWNNGREGRREKEREEGERASSWILTQNLYSRRGTILANNDHANHNIKTYTI